MRGGTHDKPLYSPARLRELLARHGLRTDKAYSQNFLIDAGVLSSVLAAADVASSDTVLEVGPGIGVLTRELAQRAARVVSVELDARLAPVLSETLAGLKNVQLVFEDALRFDLSTLPQNSILAANLPYGIATTLIVEALESGRFARLAFLVQREVGARLTASPSCAEYGALSVIVAHYGKARVLRHVKPTAFYPPPEVTSSVVRIDTHVGAGPDRVTFALIKDAFRHRRKTLHRNLVMAGYESDRVLQALSANGLDARVRAEALALEEFRRLARKLAR